MRPKPFFSNTQHHSISVLSRAAVGQDPDVCMVDLSCILFYFIYFFLSQHFPEPITNPWTNPELQSAPHDPGQSQQGAHYVQYLVACQHCSMLLLVIHQLASFPRHQHFHWEQLFPLSPFWAFKAFFDAFIQRPVISRVIWLLDIMFIGQIQI